MLRVTATGHFDAAHRLPQHDGKCANLHGHRWTVRLTLAVPEDVANACMGTQGMLVDFGVLKRRVLRPILDECLDHSMLNDNAQLLEYLAMVDRPPTAENLTRALHSWFSDALEMLEDDELPQALRDDLVLTVRVEESPGQFAEFERPLRRVREADKDPEPVEEPQVVEDTIPPNDEAEEGEPAPEDAVWPVTEIFQAYQGEGPSVGTPAVFVRLGGCSNRCAFCDTPLAHARGKLMTRAEVVAYVMEVTSRTGLKPVPNLVVVTGGDPIDALTLNGGLSIAGALNELRAFGKDLADCYAGGRRKVRMEVETHGAWMLTAGVAQAAARVSSAYADACFVVSPKRGRDLAAAWYDYAKDRSVSATPFAVKLLLDARDTNGFDEGAVTAIAADWAREFATMRYSAWLPAFFVQPLVPPGCTVSGYALAATEVAKLLRSKTDNNVDSAAFRNVDSAAFRVVGARLSVQVHKLLSLAGAPDMDKQVRLSFVAAEGKGGA